MNTKKILDILNQYWGFTSFRPKQQDVIMSIFNKRDCLALFPTGGGKSICFQVPALAMDGICIVISPLIALMKEQVDKLKKINIKALAIMSDMNHSEVDIALDNCIYGNIKLLYLSPERLQSELVQERIKKMKVSFIAIDEAHCISDWGHDFRPSYRKLSKLRILLPNIPVMALTATATNEVANDIQEQLKFKVKNVITKSFKRNNLSYLVLEEKNKLSRIKKMLDKTQGTVLIYVRSRKKADELSIKLNMLGFKSGSYHAGHLKKDRNLIQEKWINNNLRIIVATNAFGMGIDKPNVRLVIHLESPYTLESYFQETGRAGRDGFKSYAVLLYTPCEIKNILNQFEKYYPSFNDIKKIYQDLANYFQIAIGDGFQDIFYLDFDLFCKKYNWRKKKCLNILQILNNENLISFNQNNKLYSSIQFTCKASELIKYKSKNPKKIELIELILRIYPNVFKSKINIKESNLAIHLNKNKQYIIKILQQLKNESILIYNKKNRHIKIVLKTPRLKADNLQISIENLKHRKKVLINKTRKIEDYILNNILCRSKFILNYFNEKDSEDCGKCDVCLSKKNIKKDFNKEV